MGDYGLNRNSIFRSVSSIEGRFESVKTDEGKVVMEQYYHLVKQQYTNSEGGSTQLFQTILSISKKIGLDKALACLEQCVIEKRMSWLDENLKTFEKTDDPVLDGYRLFYEIYLGVVTPEDGEIVEDDFSPFLDDSGKPVPVPEEETAEETTEETAEVEENTPKKRGRPKKTEEVS